MKIASITDPLYSSFVSLDLCQQLFELGLKGETPFIWRMDYHNMEGCLHTFHFDPDLYYKQAQLNIDYINKVEYLPAWQIEDMQLLLPEWYLIRIPGAKLKYEVGCKYYKRTQIEAPRIPDAFALMLIKCIEDEKLNPLNCNYILRANSKV